MEDTATDQPNSSEVDDVEVSETQTSDKPKDSASVDETSPEKVTELLKQVTELTGKLNALSKENENFKNKEQEAIRAQQSREETLEQDLNDAQQTIHQMDQVIRYTAIVNAIQSNPDLEFHSAKHVLRELDMDALDLDVDLENGTATVSGIDNELKRIARECEWLVKRNNKAEAATTTAAKPKARPSGTPPAPPGANGSKANRRQELSKRFPVIMHNRNG